MLSQTDSQRENIDAQYENIVDQGNIDAARSQSEDHFKELSSDQIQYLRWRAKNDLLFLADGVLGYNKMTVNLHGHICKWLWDTKFDQFRLVLLPRSYYKTTLVTLTDSIQTALPDVDGTGVYPYNLGTNCRLMLGHESHTGSSRFLVEITSHFCNNPKLMGLFPECIPTPRIQRMNTAELELPRDEYWSEPTFDTMGVGAKSQGRHYNKIKLDDIFGDKARDSAAERETTIQWFDNVQSFLVDLEQDHIDLVGTRYAINDVYGHAIEVYGDLLVKYIRRIEEDDGKGNITISFPEKFSQKSIQILKKNPKVWIQYSNHPTEGLTEFEPGWKRFYSWYSREGRDLRIAVFSGQRNTIVNVRDCDVAILVDPARQNGMTGIVVTAVDSFSRVFTLDVFRGRLKDPEFINLIFRLVQQWWPRVVAIEDVLFSQLYKPWIESEQRLRGVKFHVESVKRRRIGRTDESKDNHIKALANYFSAGLIFFHETQKDLIKEYDSFGATDDIHVLDALAYGPQIWRPGMTADQWKAFKDAETELLKQRDPMTGYSI